MHIIHKTQQGEDENFQTTCFSDINNEIILSDVCSEIVIMFFKTIYMNQYQMHFRLEIRLSKLKITLREQSAKLEQIQNQLLHEGLVSLVSFCPTKNVFSRWVFVL